MQSLLKQERHIQSSSSFTDFFWGTQVSEVDEFPKKSYTFDLSEDCGVKRTLSVILKPRAQYFLRFEKFCDQ